MWLVKRDGVPVEVRSPQAATLSPVAQYGFRRYPQWDSNQAFREALYSNIYVYACARARATDLATLPIRVGADPDKPKDFDKNHPLAKLLGPQPGGPTMSLSARKLIAWTSMQFDVAGRFAWEVAPPVSQRRDGVPFELWPLVTSKIYPVPTRGGDQWFERFEYETGASRRILTPEQVLYYWRPCQEDFREPESLLRAARLNVSIATMQDRYDYAFLVNDARPAAVVVHEQFSRRAERTAFRRQFLDTHRGPDNAGKVAFVETSEGGATPKESLLIQQLGLSQRDAEFIERYENQIRAICVAFATPLSRLADSSRRTYANAERETKNYWRNAVANQAVEIAEGINVGIMPLLNDPNNVCWFDTTGVPELEPPKRYAVGDIPALIQAKVLRRNEARTGLELAEIEGLPDWDDEPELPPGPPAPLALTASAPTIIRMEPTPRDTSALLPAMVEGCRQRLDGLAQRQLQAVATRIRNKRGRQAASRDAQVADLYDSQFWFEAAEAEFYAMARMVAIAAYAANGQGSLSNDLLNTWCNQWASRMAGHWVNQWQQALQIPIANGVEGVQVAIDDAYVRAMWESCSIVVDPAQSRCDVSVISDVLLRLQQGEITCDQALASLS